MTSSAHESTRRILGELAVSAVMAVAVYLGLNVSSTPLRSNAADAVVDEHFENDVDTDAKAPAATVDAAAAQHGDAVAALMALPYAGWDDTADASLLGVTAYDEERAWPGFNLYSNEGNRVFLLDMHGRGVHAWRLPRRYNLCELPELLDSGDLLVVCVDQAMIRLDWHSNVLWQKRLRVHHDVAVLDDGSMLVLFEEPERIYNGHRVTFDGIAHLSKDGEFLSKWSTYRNLEALQAWHPASQLDTPSPSTSGNVLDYYHTNSLEVLKPSELGKKDPRFRAGNLLVCLRNVQQVVVLDQDTYEVVWAWGADELDFPHMPTMLENGHLLIFDNGLLRGYTRVIEVDVLTGEIVWQYQAEPREAFFSKWRGSSQRLPNGNTLICESEKGHVFEVTPGGEIVWEFWNPHVEDSKRRRIYRFMRLGEDRLREIRRRVGGGGR